VNNAYCEKLCESLLLLLQHQNRETRRLSEASRFQLRFAQPILAKFMWTTKWSFNPEGLIIKIKNLLF